MPAQPAEFRYLTFAREVIFGSGSLTRLREAVDRFQWQGLMLCTSRSVRSGGHVARLESALGGPLAAVYDQVRPHVQDVQVTEALDLADEKNVDAIIGMGGGSPIGMAKAVAYAIGEKRTGHTKGSNSPDEQPIIPVVAVPTTYAGSEMTPVFGITHTNETPPRKVTVNDPGIAPKLVIYDPSLTLDLPPEITASSGINALAHCIEALYSITRNPLSTAAAIAAVRHISSALLSCHLDGNDLDARTEMLLGSHLAGLSLASVTMGLHHGLCHVLGGSANVPHGIANSILLPHVIRFNAETAAPQLLPAAEAMGISIRGLSPARVMEALAQKTFDLIGRMSLPHRLRDAGVALRESDLPRLAELGFQNRTVQNNPRPVTEVAQIEALLGAAW